MTDQGYEHKRTECWEEFKRENLDGEVQWQPVSRYDVFCAAFDCAYALGKQEIKQEIKQEVIESNAVGYAMDVNNDRLSTYPEAIRPQLYPEYDMDDLANAFEAGAQFALGKQEKDADAVIQGWVARDMNDNLYVYCHKPKRNLMECLWEGEIVNIPIYNDTFPELTWESEPQECEIIIKRKKKNL